MLQRLLLLPLLSPLLVTLLVAALNPAPALSLRLLTWRSAPLSIGLWMAIAAGGGAALSAGATALALRQGGQGRLRRRVHRQEVWDDAAGSAPWGGRSTPARESPPATTTSGTATSGTATSGTATSGTAAGPSRAPGEPAPTVSVPYRVLHRPEEVPASPSRTRPSGPPRQPQTPSHPQQASEPADWGEGEDEEW